MAPRQRAKGCTGGMYAMKRWRLDRERRAVLEAWHNLGGSFGQARLYLGAIRFDHLWGMRM